MKTSLQPAAIMLTASAFMGSLAANAETYQGVQTVASVRSRDVVTQEALGAARAPIFGEAAYSGNQSVRPSLRSRRDVQRDAIATASGDPYSEAASSGVLATPEGAASRADMRSEARHERTRLE